MQIQIILTQNHVNITWSINKMYNNDKTMALCRLNWNTNDCNLSLNQLIRERKSDTCTLNLYMSYGNLKMNYCITLCTSWLLSAGSGGGSVDIFCSLLPWFNANFIIFVSPIEANCASRRFPPLADMIIIIMTTIIFHQNNGVYVLF